MAHKEAPDPRRLLDTFSDETGSLATYRFEVSMRLGPNMFSVCGNIKYTGDVLVKAASVLMWVAASHVCCCRNIPVRTVQVLVL